MPADPPQQTSKEHDRLRLAPDDVPLLWGVVDGFLARSGQGQRWPRLERIRFDLAVMMGKQERTNAE